MVTAQIQKDDYTFGRTVQEWEKMLPGVSLGKRGIPNFSLEFNGVFEFTPPVNLHPEYRIKHEGNIQLRQRAPGDFLLVIQWVYRGTMDGGEITGHWAVGVVDVDTATARRVAQFVWTPAIVEAAELSPSAINQARDRVYNLLELDDGAVRYQRERLLLIAGLDDASVSRRRNSALAVAALQNSDIELLQHDALVAFDQTLLATDDLASKMPPGAIKP